MREEHHYSLKRHNTFGIDVSCRRFLEYATTSEARQVASLLDADAPEGRVLTIGAGSNLLLTGDYGGTVVHSAIRGKTLAMTPHSNAATLCCGSGETWDDVVAWTVDMGFADLVNLSLIPGEVGAAAVQNIGAYGDEAAQHIKEIRTIEMATGQTVTIDARECHYGYRDSRFKHEWKDRYLITHVVLSLDRDYTPKLEYGNIRQALQQQGITDATARQLRDIIIDIRRSKLPEPSETGNAGSFFMNPVVGRRQYEALQAQYPDMPHYDVDRDSVKIPAGWLIDRCGWKGRSMGRAGVYSKQALVLVNLGGATGSDIVELCHAVQHDVEQRFGIMLKPEVNIV